MTSEDDYELMKKYVGEQGIPALVFNESTPLYEPQEIEYVGMSIGKKYHLFITCNFADDFSKQSFQEEVYEIVESTKPDVELTVVGNVEPDQPYKVSYTIKAPNGDCRGIRYVENSMSEWNASLRPEYGMDEKFYVTNYGLDVTDADVIQAINSSEGYKMYFDSFPEEENMLVVQAYNEDEDLSEPYMAKATAVADFGTPVDAGGQSVLDALCGTWNATFNRQGSNGETETITFPIEFSREPEEAGEYADYDKLVNTIMTMKNMTEEEAKLYIEEEKDKGILYARRERGKRVFDLVNHVFEVIQPERRTLRGRNLESREQAGDVHAQPEHQKRRDRPRDADNDKYLLLQGQFSLFDPQNSPAGLCSGRRFSGQYFFFHPHFPPQKSNMFAQTYPIKMKPARPAGRLFQKNVRANIQTAVKRPKGRYVIHTEPF